MTDPVNHPRVVRDPELAFVLSQIQNVRGSLDRIEAALVKPVPQPQVRTLRTWPRQREFWRDSLMADVKALKVADGPSNPPPVRLR